MSKKLYPTIRRVRVRNHVPITVYPFTHLFLVKLNILASPNEKKNRPKAQLAMVSKQLSPPRSPSSQRTGAAKRDCVKRRLRLDFDRVTRFAQPP
jgi:hypothetical protein